MSQESSKVNEALVAYAARLGDNALILAQRMVERVAAEAELETELANANFALDFLGQARMFYSRAGELEGKGRDEDDFAMLRDEHEFRNLLLLEQPIDHFGDALIRQYLFEVFYLHLLEALVDCSDSGIVEVARKPTTLYAETLTFFRIDEETLFSRLEAKLDITGGGIRELEIRTSASAGTNLRFQIAAEHGQVQTTQLQWHDCATGS